VRTASIAAQASSPIQVRWTTLKLGRLHCPADAINQLAQRNAAKHHSDLAASRSLPRLGLRRLPPFVKPLLAQLGTEDLKVIDDRSHTQSSTVTGPGTIHANSLFNILMILPADADAS
jgi:hypothetical protein